MPRDANLWFGRGCVVWCGCGMEGGTEVMGWRARGCWGWPVQRFGQHVLRRAVGARSEAKW
eukprot:14498682-Alexandrium_andersonii.AAC.1